MKKKGTGAWVCGDCGIPDLIAFDGEEWNSVKSFFKQHPVEDEGNGEFNPDDAFLDHVDTLAIEDRSYTSEPLCGTCGGYMEWHPGIDIEALDRDTLVIDLAKVVGIRKDDASPCFSERVFDLIFHADVQNRQRLAEVFPIQVLMVERYQNVDGVIVDPRNPKGGAYVPKDSGGHELVRPFDDATWRVQLQAKLNQEPKVSDGG